MPFAIANKISRHQFNKNFAKSKCEKLQNTLKRQIVFKQMKRHAIFLNK